MIEVEGIAYPLERGKTYLLVVNRRTVSQSVWELLPSVLKDKFDIDLIMLGVEGGPDSVALLGPPAIWTCRCGTVNGVNLPICRVCGRKEGEEAR